MNVKDTDYWCTVWTTVSFQEEEHEAAAATEEKKKRRVALRGESHQKKRITVCFSDYTLSLFVFTVCSGLFPLLLNHSVYCVISGYQRPVWWQLLSIQSHMWLSLPGGGGFIRGDNESAFHEVILRQLTFLLLILILPHMASVLFYFIFFSS